jgi:hypothetical protein
MESLNAACVQPGLKRCRLITANTGLKGPFFHLGLVLCAPAFAQTSLTTDRYTQTMKISSRYYQVWLQPIEANAVS